MNEQPKLYRLRDVGIENNPLPVFDEVLAYWNRCRGERLAPSWTDVDLMAFPPRVLPYTIVVDIQAPPRPVLYRFYGSGIAKNHGFEMTNRSSDDIQPEQLRQHILSQYAIIVEARAPRLFATEIYVKQGIRLQDLLLRLPLSNDGETVTNVITVEQHWSEGDPQTGTDC
ncbi:MAG: PAS domain-containing protein [Rhodospirillales bacterium]